MQLVDPGSVNRQRLTEFLRVVLHDDLTCDVHVRTPLAHDPSVLWQTAAEAAGGLPQSLRVPAFGEGRAYVIVFVHKRPTRPIQDFRHCACRSEQCGRLLSARRRGVLCGSQASGPAVTPASLVFSFRTIRPRFPQYSTSPKQTRRSRVGAGRTRTCDRRIMSATRAPPTPRGPPAGGSSRTPPRPYASRTSTAPIGLGGSGGPGG